MIILRLRIPQLLRSLLSEVDCLACIPDEGPIKALLCEELAESSRRVGRPFLRFNDTLKDILSAEQYFSHAETLYQTVRGGGG